MGDRYNIHSQLEHLQSKYIGTGHADTSKWEWCTNQHRDSYASYMGHVDMINFFALVENEARARVRLGSTFNCLVCFIIKIILTTINCEIIIMSMIPLVTKRGHVSSRFQLDWNQILTKKVTL